LSWQRLLAFDHFQYGGIFTGDIVMRRSDDLDVEVIIAAQNFLPPKAGCFGFTQSVGNAFDRGFVFRVYIKVSFAGADGVGAEHGAFDDQMRQVLEQHPVLSAPGLIFAAIHHQIMRLLRGFPGELPFFSRRKTCAAMAA
jgi:hypothetical protein